MYSLRTAWACSGCRQEAHVKFRTPQQEHDFGHPYQLGHLEAADKPDESMLMTLPVSGPLRGMACQ